MAVRNLHFYNANEGRAYPIDDAASCEADDGSTLPPNLLADCNLRWPSTLGAYAFVSAVSVTDTLVTVTVQAADAPDAAGGFAPLAVLNVRRPVTKGRVYAVAPQAAGVGGWLVFGSGAELPYRGRFSSPAQSRLCPRTARAYRPLPVTGMRAGNAAAALTGVVTIRAAEPLAVVKESRYLDGAYRDAVVVRLVDDSGVDGFPVPQEVTNISGYKAVSLFSQFAGPCSGRPEAGTCGCPEPIEFVNAVGPDCDGTLTIEFAGCATLARIQDTCGVVVSCGLGLADACLPPQIPSSAGLLPGEYEPALVPPPPDVPEPPVAAESVSTLPPIGLPFAACFRDSIGELGTAVGGWTFSEDGVSSEVCPPQSESLSASGSVSVSILPDGSYESATASTRCVALSGAEASAYRRATTEVKLTQGPAGALHNAQLVVNYRPHASVPGQFVYFAAEVDYDSQQFRLLRFNGNALQTVTGAAVNTPGIQLDKWYRVTAEVTPGPVAGQAHLVIRVQSVTDPGVLDVSLGVDVSGYSPADGYFGIGTNRAVSRFGYLTVEETP